MTLHRLLQFCLCRILEVKGSIESVELATMFIEYLYNCKRTNKECEQKMGQSGTMRITGGRITFLLFAFS